MPLAVLADVDTMSPKLRYVHPDQVGRPSKMTDASQAVVWDVWYWPYGETRSIAGAATLNLRAPGQYYLAESGLMYNWHRHYDPSLGRYTQLGPIADVLAAQPANLDGSPLIADGGITGGSQLVPAILPPQTGSRIGAELPTFADEPSIYHMRNPRRGCMSILKVRKLPR